MKIGIALSGGGVRGAAHIGVIKALEENNIKIDCIAGTSAGAIVSALYAMGYNTNEMLKLFEYFAKDIMEINPKFIFNSIRKQKSIKISGLASSYGIEKTMNETAKIKKMKKIKDIGMPIAIPATDLLNCKKVVFTNRELIGDYYVQDIEIGKAVRASSNFPGMYEPFEYREYQFVDGGIYDNLPIGELRNMGADKTIGVKFDIDNKKKQSTIYNISMKSIDLMQEVAMQESIKQADGLININLREVKAFNVDKVDFCYEQGYKQTIKNISKIKQVLNMEN